MRARFRQVDTAHRLSGTWTGVLTSRPVFDVDDVSTEPTVIAPSARVTTDEASKPN
jgi:hypothetical protein